VGGGGHCSHEGTGGSEVLGGRALSLGALAPVSLRAGQRQGCSARTLRGAQGTPGPRPAARTHWLGPVRCWHPGSEPWRVWDSDGRRWDPRQQPPCWGRQGRAPRPPGGLSGSRVPNAHATSAAAAGASRFGQCSAPTGAPVGPPPALLACPSGSQWGGNAGAGGEIPAEGLGRGLGERGRLLAVPAWTWHLGDAVCGTSDPRQLPVPPGARVNWAARQPGGAEAAAPRPGCPSLAQTRSVPEKLTAPGPWGRRDEGAGRNGTSAGNRGGDGPGPFPAGEGDDGGAGRGAGTGLAPCLP